MLPRKKFRFLEYFKFKSGNGLMFESDQADSDFEFHTEPRTIFKEGISGILGVY